MIHVATVHWRDPRWIDPQLRAIRRHLGEHRVYASVEGLPAARTTGFDVAIEMEGTHPEKLNRLAASISSGADADDLLLFLDGDAFPIAPVDGSVLHDTPLAAVRRDENLGDRQPHPCFCLTTVGYWNAIGGDWRRGHRWQNSLGEWVTDTGGNLLGILETRGDPWHPLLRSNRRELHPLWFGIYEDLAYHHGAGFRDPVARVTTTEARAQAREQVQRRWIPEAVPLLSRVERSVRFRLAQRDLARETARRARDERALADEVFAMIERDDDFYRCFLSEPEART